MKAQKAPKPFEKDYFPEEHDRRWYRHKNGQSGWFVKVGGKPCIKWDRVNEDIIVAFKKDEWTEEKRYRPHSISQVILVAYAADQQLCRLLGDHEKSRRAWEDMTEDQRIEWCQTGPTNPPIRQTLYQAIMGVVREMAGV